METLTKENFWDEMSQKYPNAMKLFLDWVDRYKAINSWYHLFNHGADTEQLVQMETGSPKSLLTMAPKFHELPIAMQLGIFIEFSYSLLDNFNGGSVIFSGKDYESDVRKSMTICLWWVEIKLTDNKERLRTLFSEKM